MGISSEFRFFYGKNIINFIYERKKFHQKKFSKRYMAWYRGTGIENHKSVFENVSHNRCIFCGDDRTEIARTDFTIMFSPEEYNTGSICKTCYHANAKQVKAL